MRPLHADGILLDFILGVSAIINPRNPKRTTSFHLPDSGSSNDSIDDPSYVLLSNAVRHAVTAWH